MLHVSILKAVIGRASTRAINCCSTALALQKKFAKHCRCYRSQFFLAWSAEDQGSFDRGAYEVFEFSWNLLLHLVTEVQQEFERIGAVLKLNSILCKDVRNHQALPECGRTT